MNNDFEILANFLDSFEPEVSGRSSDPISDAESALIAKMAAGDLSESERADLAPLLASNDQAMQSLVRALKSEAN